MLFVRGEAAAWISEGCSREEAVQFGKFGEFVEIGFNDPKGEIFDGFECGAAGIDDDTGLVIDAMLDEITVHFGCDTWGDGATEAHDDVGSGEEVEFTGHAVEFMVGYFKALIAKVGFDVGLGVVDGDIFAGSASDGEELTDDAGA